MWTRKELKQQAKEALQRNYWKCVLVAFLLMTLGGNLAGNLFSSASGASNGVGDALMEEADLAEEDTLLMIDGNEYPASVLPEENDEWLVEADEIIDDMDRTEMIIGLSIAVVIFFIIFLAVIAALLAFEIFLVFPMIVGAGRFMLKSLDGRGEMKEVAYAFDHSYKNVVKTMFHTQLSIFLWSLLFVIPGIYKQYQYRMVEYILAEQPDLYYKDVMKRSKEMMEGEKWHAFVLDLSFILWEVAGVLTCGIAYILFVAPYQYLTRAALYRRLCAGHGGYADIREGVPDRISV